MSCPRPAVRTGGPRFDRADAQLADLLTFGSLFEVAGHLQLQAVSVDDFDGLPPRCIAANTEDRSTAEVWLSMEKTRALLDFAYGQDGCPSNLPITREPITVI
jgi:hypothetical protein